MSQFLKYILYINFLWIFCGYAGESYKNSDKDSPKKDVSTIVKDALVNSSDPDDISKVSARLKVEGASFRPFRLLINKTQPKATLSSAQKAIVSTFWQVIDRDLSISGGFQEVKDASSYQSDALLKQFGAEGTSHIELSFHRNELRITVTNKHLITSKSNSVRINGALNNHRSLAHKVSQSIFEEFIGKENLFNLQFAAVKRDKKGSQIVLMDFDGSNERAITDGAWIKSSPFFAPDGQSILYTVITPEGQGIIEHNLNTNQKQFRTKKTGLNLDPRVFPNDKNLLITLSLGQSSNIYQANRDGSNLKKITNSLGINLSPTIDASGTKMAFVSTRSGSPQIYWQSLAAEQKAVEAKRLTFKGSYNQTPVFNPSDSNYLAFTGRDENKQFDIFLLEISSGRISRITEGQGRNQEPFFSPSGRYVIFSSERDSHKKAEIYLASLNGNHQVRITLGGGYFSPVVRPVKP